MSFFGTMLEKATAIATDEVFDLKAFLNLIREDPAMALSIYETANGILEDGTIRLSEGLIEDFIAETLMAKSEMITEIACCGLDSNRLFLYGEAEVSGFSVVFRVFIEPKEVIWKPGQKTFEFAVSAIQIEGNNTTTQVTTKLTNYLVKTIFPGVLGMIAAASLKKAIEALMMKAIKENTRESLPQCQVSGKSMVLDLEGWETTSTLLNFEIPESRFTKAVRLDEVLFLESIFVDRKGIGIKLNINEDSEAIGILKDVWGAIRNFSQ